MRSDFACGALFKNCHLRTVRTVRRLAIWRPAGRLKIAVTIDSRHNEWMFGVADLNRMDVGEFAGALSGIYESSPWIPEAVAGERPFGDIDSLEAALWEKVQAADVSGQLALLNAHPDLAGRLAMAGELTPESAREQASAGLDCLTPREFEMMSALNDQYRDRFGFPFIICVREHDRASIIRNFQARLQNSRESEILAALYEVRRIAKLRLADLIGES